MAYCRNAARDLRVYRPVSAQARQQHAPVRRVLGTRAGDAAVQPAEMSGLQVSRRRGAIPIPSRLRPRGPRRSFCAAFMFDEANSARARIVSMLWLSDSRAGFLLGRSHALR